MKSNTAGAVLCDLLHNAPNVVAAPLRGVVW